MGNQLTGVAPSQILPVEHYLADNIEYEYESRYKTIVINILFFQNIDFILNATFIFKL